MVKRFCDRCEAPIPRGREECGRVSAYLVPAGRDRTEGDGWLLDVCDSCFAQLTQALIAALGPIPK